jgi:hypothetical protein
VKGVRTMRRLELRRAHTIVPDEGGEPRESFLELVRISQRTFKQAKLLPCRSRGTRQDAGKRSDDPYENFPTACESFGKAPRCRRWAKEL